MTFPDYGNCDGLGLVELVRKKTVSPSELVEEAIARIAKHNSKINAVVLPLFERARAAAKGELPDGPFKGVPFLMKDLIATLEGVPTSSGNKLLRNLPAKISTEMAKRWENSGVVVVGKTNTPEFGLTPYTESDNLCPARNPWDTSRTPGGSSGGSVGCRGRRSDRATRVRRGRRRLHPHPLLCLRFVWTQAHAWTYSDGSHHRRVLGRL